MTLNLLKILLFLYKNREPISTLDLNERISKDKYKISIYNFNSKNNFASKYLANSCDKEHIVHFLVEHGVNVNGGMEIPLRRASDVGNLNVVKYLVKHGADINKITDFEEYPSALFDACNRGHKTIVKYLIEKGANISIRNYNEITPLLLACGNRNENLVKYLIEHGADVNMEDC